MLSLPGSSVQEIVQATILEWVAIPFFRGSSQPRIEPASLASHGVACKFFTTEPLGPSNLCISHKGGGGNAVGKCSHEARQESKGLEENSHSS